LDFRVSKCSDQLGYRTVFIYIPVQVFCKENIDWYQNS